METGDGHAMSDEPQLSLHSGQRSPKCQLTERLSRTYRLNVAFVGGSRVGKTKLLQRFVESSYNDVYSRTDSLNFVSKSLYIGPHRVVLSCWDTPGSVQQFGSLPTEFQNLHAVFVVFDASRDATAELRHWSHLLDVKYGYNATLPLVAFVANKTDLGLHRPSVQLARQLANERSGQHFQLSVLQDDESVEVDDMILQIGSAVVMRLSSSTEDDGDDNQLEDNDSGDKKVFDNERHNRQEVSSDSTSDSMSNANQTEQQQQQPQQTGGSWLSRVLCCCW